jgi:protein SCO1/2
MQRFLLPAILVVAAVFLGSLVLLMVLRGGGVGVVRDPIALIPDRVVEGLSIPDFTLTDQDGREVTQAVFEGHVTILDFIFTDCPAICPMMSGVVAELSQALSGTDVRFMSISVNPERDTSSRLRRYGERYGADFGRWSFLTGNYATVERIVRGSLQFELRRDPARTVAVEDGQTTYNVVHPGKLILVGPDRRVLGMYEYALGHEVKALEDRARRAAKR